MVKHIPMVNPQIYARFVPNPRIPSHLLDCPKNVFVTIPKIWGARADGLGIEGVFR